MTECRNRMRRPGAEVKCLLPEHHNGEHANGGIRWPNTTQEPPPREEDIAEARRLIGLGPVVGSKSQEGER